MNVSSLFGKKVESTEGKSGYVVGVRAYGGNIECLTCADEDENEFTVDCLNVKKWGERIIFDDRQKISSDSAPLRLGLPAYDENGRFLGELTDFTLKGRRLIRAKIGKKNYPAEGVCYADAAIVRVGRRLKADVIKDGKILLKKGEPLTEENLKIAEKAGEYVQTNLKSI